MKNNRQELINLDERRLIKKLISHGIKAPQIAKTLGRSEAAIYREFKRCGRIKDYDPDKAQIHFIQSISKIYLHRKLYLSLINNETV